MNNRQFLVTTTKSPEGIVFSYRKDDDTFCGIEFKEKMPVESIIKIVAAIQPTIDLFLTWVANSKHNITVVELQMQISFEMFWNKYDDKLRSSKKRSQKLWEKLNEENQVKAYYFYDKYNRHRGNADKKYCETYLSAELWNN